jgi:hypothetical protein
MRQTYPTHTGPLRNGHWLFQLEKREMHSGLYEVGMKRSRINKAKQHMGHCLVATSAAMAIEANGNGGPYQFLTKPP